MRQITDAELEDRLERAADPNHIRKLTDDSDLDLGGNRQEKEIADILRALDDPDLVAPTRRPFAFDPADLEDVEIIPTSRDYVSPYDRAFRDRVELETALEGLVANSDEYHAIMGQLADVKNRIRIELERSTDETFRQRHIMSVVI